MLLFLCNDQRDWEEPGHLKFLNASQEDTANNLAYIVPMNIVNRVGVGYNVPRGKVSPPPSNLSLSLLCNDQRDWEEPDHLKFLNALPEDAGNNFSYVVPINIVNNLPRGEVYTLPLNLHVLQILIMFIGTRYARLFAMNSFQQPLESHSETSNDHALLNPFDHYIKMKAYMRVECGGDTLPRGRSPPPHWLCS